MTRPLTTPLSVEIDEYIASQLNLRPKTRKEYLHSLTRFDRWLGGGTLRHLTAENVNKYASIKVEAGSIHIARNDVASLRAFSKWLTFRAKHLSENPLASVSVPKVPQAGRPAFRDQEVVEIIAAASNSRLPATSSRDRLIVMMALWTGLRLNELRNLRWPDDIDLREGMLYVRASKTDAGIRSVPLDDAIMGSIRSYVHSYRAWGEQPGPLFLNQHGEAFTYNGFARVQGRIRDRLVGSGIDYKIHRLRNTWAKKMRTLNIDLLDIQQMGGWTDIAMVRRYAGKKPDAELKRLPTMSNIFKGVA